jgi:signal peptidase I
MGFMCATAGVWIPGLGHFIAGHRRRGVRWFFTVYGLAVLCALLYAIPMLVPGLILLVPALWLAQLAVLVDGYRTGHRNLAVALKWPHTRYATGLLFLILSLALNPLWVPILFVRQYWSEAFVMPTQSMAPTIQPGDRIIVHKQLRPQRYDIVAFHPPEQAQQMWIFRVVGLPGEQVEILNGEVYIDGKQVPRPAGVPAYTSTIPGALLSNGTQGHPMQLGRDEYYVLGDNSRFANDSRLWQAAAPMHQPGALPADSITGVATWTYWPPRHWRRLN